MHTVHVAIHARADLSPPPPEGDLALLSAAERAHLATLRAPSAVADYAMGRALLRRTLSTAAGGGEPHAWPLVVDERGRVLVDGTSWRVSITHTTGLVACAVADGLDVGVDAERLDRRVDVDGLLHQVFAPDERAVVLALPGDQRPRHVLRRWVIKEACAKALGLGLALPLPSVITRDDEKGPSVQLAHEPARVLSADWVDAGPGHAVALVAAGPRGAWLIRRVPPSARETA